MALAGGHTGAEGALTHGLNLSVCISDATPENCLWVVPGSHRRWRLAPWPGRRRDADGRALTDGSFPPISDWLADAVPVTLRPGDVMVVDRSSLHGARRGRCALLCCSFDWDPPTCHVMAYMYVRIMCSGHDVEARRNGQAPTPTARPRAE